MDCPDDCFEDCGECESYFKNSLNTPAFDKEEGDTGTLTETPVLTPIVTDEDLLSKVCKSLDLQDPLFKDTLDQVVAKMMRVVNEHTDTCVGLAANQVGEFVRVILIRGDEQVVIFLINPVVILCWGGFISCEETCLSRPDHPGLRVRRARFIRVRFWDPVVSKFMTHTFKDIFAIIVQHEIDHLNGKYIGKLTQ